MAGKYQKDLEAELLVPRDRSVVVEMACEVLDLHTENKRLRAALQEAIAERDEYIALYHGQTKHADAMLGNVVKLALHTDLSKLHEKDFPRD